MKLSNRIFAVIVSLSFAAPAFAGGPLANCNSGQPFLWGNGGRDITFNPDQGNLGPVAGPDAIDLVGQAFQVWEDIPSSTLAYVAGPQLPEDVDINNFGPYLSALTPDGLSAVVFDDTGEIFDLITGPGSGVLGFAGPEWTDTTTCEITEGLSFLNGPSFTNTTAAFDVMVHEFGHWSNFAHTVVNGQIWLGSVGGDTTGPTPDNDTFGAAPFPIGTDYVETMYPFYYGPGIGTGSVEADDIAIASRLYPEAGYSDDTGTISGTIYFGSSKVTGANVIARNFADPFNDAVSAISSDFTDSTDQADPNVGVYTITGLTPGANYGVFVDTVLAGGFSTTLAAPLPGPEEFYNGANESSDSAIDNPVENVPVAVSAGVNTSGIDILLNIPKEGEPLQVGDDGGVLIGLPFTYGICGQDYNNVYVNANGHLTFGAPPPQPDWAISLNGFLDGPPRIAGLWTDLQPFNPFSGAQQGIVYFSTTNNTFTATWEDVPEWDFPAGTGSNTFSITLKQGSSQATVNYGDMDAPFPGIVGVSCGLAQTGGAEQATPLQKGKKRTTHNFNNQTAVYDVYFGASELSNYSLKYNTTKHKLKDKFEKNNSVGEAAPVSLPFSSAPNSMFTELAPAAGDVDYYKFEGTAGNALIAQVLRGQIDSVLGLFDSNGDLIAFNDDFGGTLLSSFGVLLPYTGTYYIGVTFCCDYDFDGVDPGQGGALDGGRYVLELETFTP